MKRCPGCELNLDAQHFWKSSSTKSGLQSRCKSCQQADQRRRHSTEAGKEAARQSAQRWKERNPATPEQMERKRKAMREWARRNPQWFKDWRMNNRQKWNQINNRAQAKAVEGLGDAYVKKKIARGEISHTLIPKALVELKRVQLAIHRHIKEANQE